MKYFETIFDIGYLLFVIISGIIMIRKSKTKFGLLLGFATVTLGLGDAFHLVPRVMNYFIETDLTLFLGIGKLVTSLTITIFYMLLYWAYESYYEKESDELNLVLGLLVITRIILCMLPGNDWINNNDNLTYAIIRNVPFIIIGITMIYLFYKQRKEKRESFKYIWLLILLSFIFYLPVILLSSKIKMIGMLMIPKTICYVLMIVNFNKVFKKSEI